MFRGPVVGLFGMALACPSPLSSICPLASLLLLGEKRRNRQKNMDEKLFPSSRLLRCFFFYQSMPTQERGHKFPREAAPTILNYNCFTIPPLPHSLTEENGAITLNWQGKRAAERDWTKLDGWWCQVPGGSSEGGGRLPLRLLHSFLFLFWKMGNRPENRVKQPSRKERLLEGERRINLGRAMGERKDEGDDSQGEIQGRSDGRRKPWKALLYSLWDLYNLGRKILLYSTSSLSPCRDFTGADGRGSLGCTRRVSALPN